MPHYRCEHCDGFGSIIDPSRRWGVVWHRLECEKCGGDGIAKPPGWPNADQIRSYRPTPPPLPPPRKPE